ncbi:MAG: hypothetical protein IKV15_00080 [Bacteroidaceae bacterium]|nr:hypothetical protein [Bacteroidaceae bacterium]
MRFSRDMLRSDIEGERAALQRGPVGYCPCYRKSSRAMMCVPCASRKA